MYPKWVLALAALAAGLGGAASAQEVLLQDPQVPGLRIGGGQYYLAPADTQVVGAPLFLSDVNRAAVAQPLPTDLAGSARAAATVSGNGLGDLGTLPAIFPNLRVDIGFEYLRPDFPGRSVNLSVPAGVNGSFTSLGSSGNVSYDFAFVPRITMNYQFPDNPFGLTASGELTHLSGHLTRTIDSASGSANLTATATVDIGVANVIEGSLRFPLGRFDHFKDGCLEDTIVLLTLGMRFSHISQDYNASLDSSGNGSTLAAHQDWDGFGLTTSYSFLHPLPRNFFLYGVTRGSFMLGTNNRVSTSTVVANGAGSTSTKLTDNRTEFIPVGEFEAGVGWGKPLGKQIETAERAAAAPVTGPILWVKAGLVADIWGDLGLLAAPAGSNSFSDSPLFLWGFTVMAGLDF
jgi:hypothetical protein